MINKIAQEISEHCKNLKNLDQGMTEDCKSFKLPSEKVAVNTWIKSVRKQSGRKLGFPGSEIL